MARCLPVISEQTDFSLCDAGQAIGRPAARLWRIGVVMLSLPPLGEGRLSAPSDRSPRPSCSIAFSAFSSRVGSPGGGARDQAMYEIRAYYF